MGLSYWQGGTASAVNFPETSTHKASGQLSAKGNMGGSDGRKEIAHKSTVSLTLQSCLAQHSHRLQMAQGSLDIS